MRGVVGVLVVVVCCLTMAGGVVGESPEQPAGYYGTVQTDTGAAVPDGTELRLTVDNETTTTVAVTNGTYEVYLEADGETVSFWVEETYLTSQPLEATRTEQNLTVPASVGSDDSEEEPDDGDTDGTSEEETDTQPSGGGGTQTDTEEGDTTAEEDASSTPTTNETTAEDEPPAWPTAANFTADPESIITVDDEDGIQAPGVGELQVTAPTNTTVAVGMYPASPTTPPPGAGSAVVEVRGDAAPTVTVPGNDSVPLRALSATEDGWELIAESAPGTPLVFEPPRDRPVAVVQAPPPAVTVSVPERVAVGETVVLNATVEGGAGAVRTYRWTVNETVYTGSTPAVELEEAGTHSVTLTVQTELNTTTTTTAAVVVEDTDRWPWLEVVTGVILFVTLLSAVTIRRLTRRWQ